MLFERFDSRLPKSSYKLKKQIMDGEQRSQEVFSGRQEQMSLWLELRRKEGEATLNLRLTDLSSSQCHCLTVGQQYLSEHSQMLYCFDTPQDLFLAIVQLFDNSVQLAPSSLRLQMKLNASNLKKKVFTLVLQPAQLDQQDRLQIGLERSQEEWSSQLAERDERISVLNAEVLQQRESIKQLQNQQQELCLQRRRQELKITGLFKQNEAQRQEISSLKRLLESYQLALTNSQLYSYYENPHWHYFGVSRQGQWATIVKKGGEAQWHSFILPTPLPTRKYSRHGVRLIRTSNSDVMLGVGTRRVFGKSDIFRQNMCVMKNCNNGRIWSGGVGLKQGLGMEEDDLMVLEAWLGTGKIGWVVNGARSGQVQLPATMEREQLFFIIMMYSSQDQVQLLLE